jgi:type IV pilus assembly protein PilC
MRDSVERGDGLEGPLRAAEKSGYLPGVVVDMLITGEETGTMDTIADQIADSYEQELELQVDGLKEALGPIMVIGIGLAVGSIVIALFLPLVQLISEISSAGI